MDDLESHLVEEVRAGRMTRAELIKRASIAGLALPAVSALLAACGGGGTSSSSGTTTGTAGTAKRGGTAKVSATVPAQDVDPVTMYNQGAIVTAQGAGEYLAYPNPDFTLDPRLATSWKSVGTPKTWEFKLRQGVQWHDGKPFTADDVVYTMDLLTNPKSGSAALSAFAGILSRGNVEKVDAQTVQFHLDRVYADFPYLVSPFNYNSIILPKGYEIGSFTKGGIGTGAFMLQKYSAKSQAVYVKNPNYWDKTLPYLDGLVVKYYDDNPPQVLALQAGAIDVMDEVPYQGSQALFSDPNVAVLANPSSQYRTLQMRADQTPFSSKQVRQAVAYSLNRQQLIQGLFNGFAQLGNDHGFAPIFPDSPTAADVPQREQNYNMAKQLLSQAGQSNLSVTLTTEQYLEIPQYAQLIQQMCKPAGIDVKLNVEPQATFYGSGNNQPWLQVPFGITDWASRGTPSQTIDPAYLCRSVPNKNLSNAGAWNSAHWCDPQFDKLMAQFEAEVDHQKRKQLAIQAAKIQQDGTPDVIAYWIKEFRATRKNVHGIAPGNFAFDPRAMWIGT